MEKPSGVLCLSWDSKIHAVAQSSLTQANQLLSCIKQERSLQEVSLFAQEAISGFRKLLILLDKYKSSYRKRIREGPLPKTHDLNHVEFMDFSPSSSQPFVIRQFFPPSYSSQTISTVVVPTIIDHPTSNSLISMCERNSTNTHRVIHYPSSSELLAPEVSNSSMFSSKSRACGATKSENTGARCAASTGGCHCSKRRKLRVRRRIRVPLVSNKLDVPPDEYSWRKYGQKPIKGSPYPRSYYKCSRVKGCPARKHVERCLDDATMLVVTYEGDHNHTRITFQPPTLMIQAQH